jgi:hypothetical protein
MFDGATSFNQRLGNTASEWQTGNVLDMSFMFRGATSFNAGASGPDTDNQIFSNVSSVTTMESMFAGATSYNGGGTQNMASLWEPSACTNFKNMFSGASIVGTSAGGQLSLSLSQWSSYLLYTSIDANNGFENMLLGSGYLDGTAPRHSSYTGSATPAANNVGDWETLWGAAPP